MRPAATLLLLAFLASATVAGCAQAPAPAEEPAASAAPPPPANALDWRQWECEAVTWSVPVTAAALQPHLPAGFQPSPPEASPQSPGVDGAATVGFRAVECSYGFGEEKVLRSMQSGVVFTPVLPPAELREERFASHYSYGWDVLVASDAWRAAARPWGLPLGDGGALVGPTAQGWTGSLAIDRVGAFTMSGRPLDDVKAAEGFEARTITAGAQGFAMWDSETSNRSVSAGVGTWTVSPESWVAGVLGATSGLATFEYSRFDLPVASVHWPGQALGPTEEDAPLGPADLLPPPPSPPLAPLPAPGRGGARSAT